MLLHRLAIPAPTGVTGSVTTRAVASVTSQSPTLALCYFLVFYRETTIHFRYLAMDS
jgi:hypothetical protein